MDPLFFTSMLVLLQLICVIIVVAYLLTRTRFFPEVLEGHPTLRAQVILILVFGALSIYGTLSGIEFLGAPINVRDLGPMLAGLLGGPLAGLGAGLIGAAHRMTMGGFTVYPCSLATVLAGLIGGLIWLLHGRRFAGIMIAVLFAILMEGLHMLLVLAICRPFGQAVEIVSMVAFPMIVGNAVGMFVFAFMVENLISERKMQAERDTLLREMERKNTEIAIAAEIQQSFLPDTITQIPGYDIAGKSVMAKEVGGDFFDVIPLEVVPMGTGRLGIMIADVSGKGIPAALFMALSRIVVRVNATWYGQQPSAAIRDSNTIIANDSKSGMFVTLWYGLLESATRKLIYVNAGHNPPIHFRAADRSLAELPATGIAMGVMDDAGYTQESVDLAQGDILILYTDGITEAENENLEMFGTERLQQVILASSELSANAICTEILNAVKNFTGSHPQSDDITLMVIRSL
ncbi:PP2C family protein-serine/threonine phosphatase [Methanoregula sp. PtaB.Bin085]|uniref:PP2C family protein-serine/threonine phosphatase n=1 Tax=Methanoregula sp. PtaB.Bin085 TaxID=1811680 RepID=UPI0009CF4D0E|nr:SpoIIE family protein phosphatase [Methanoregula sp. PtaB.Bin085]OPX64610.1 MAG: Stage II sporulation protein E (SpoIIE) [Methanoregula sp. PtaB.Bin085]